MKNKLVIVESPTKARTITRFLGSDVKVIASMGHVRDLPENSLGVDVRSHFKPQYTLTGNGKKVFAELKGQIAGVQEIYLATDPDREGEAIAWHLQQALHPYTQVPFHRISFHEITKEAILHAFAEPGELDINRVDAQQARRVLDRLVGYQVSPMLWKSVKKGTSAGRVQSVALRLICERERTILDFKPVEFWTMEALFAAQPKGEIFLTKLTKLDGQKPQVPNADMANALAAELEKAAFNVADVTKTPRTQRAPPPFITSTLQQAAGASLHMGTGMTMRVAQELYEGIELGKEGPVGLITYMRTDAVNVAKEAQDAARKFIVKTFGPDYAPATPNLYRSRSSAQAAHEAIRPTDVKRTPDSVTPFLTPPQAKVYRLIWNRFMASQMAPAQMLEHTIEVAAAGSHLTHAYMFTATTVSPVFPGYLKVYDLKDVEQLDQENGEEEEVAKRLPDLTPGALCDLEDLKRKQNFTDPPRRYTEATLVKELEQNGIGRPSTYASIVETIQERDYVKKEKGRLLPTTLGFNVNDFLVSRLSQLFDVGFTARMETSLDEIEEGKVNWTDMLEEFYRQFQAWSGTLTPVAAPDNAKILRFLKVFPENLPWTAPVKRGTKVFDDHKFYLSLCEQAAGPKPVSDKQWMAILTMAYRYLAHIPGLREVARELGIESEFDAVIRRAQEQEKASAGAAENAAAQNNSDEIPTLIETLKNVNWEQPNKRGGKFFSDRQFFQSLAKQVANGRILTLPQINALRKLTVKYRSQLPEFDALAARFTLEIPQPAAMDATDAANPDQTVPALFAMVDTIKEWTPAAQRGKRTFDDQKFAISLKDQYLKLKTISPRQVEALKSLLQKYRSQIPDFETRAAALGLVKAAPQLVDAKCPLCGGQLVKRQRRGQAFFGCSAYPRCRFTATTMPEAAPVATPESGS